MKKIVIGLMILTLTVALSLSVMASEHEAWELVDGQWSHMGYVEGYPNLQANARAWSRYPKVGICNKTSWPINVTVHASVAQWVDWSISGTRYEWQVRKPGEYAANSLTATLKSNGPVTVDFAGFGNLYSADSVNQEIETWYAYGGTLPGSGDARWIPANALDGVKALVKDSVELHDGYDWKLWNKIKVVECNSACEYEDNAIITLVLDNQKDWIEPGSGYFAAGN